MELPEDLWRPLYDRVNYPLVFKILTTKIIDQMYERACRRWPGDSCVDDIVFYRRSLFEMFKIDEFGRKRRRSK